MAMLLSRGTQLLLRDGANAPSCVPGLVGGRDSISHRVRATHGTTGPVSSAGPPRCYWKSSSLTGEIPHQKGRPGAGVAELGPSGRSISAAHTAPAGRAGERRVPSSAGPGPGPGPGRDLRLLCSLVCGTGRRVCEMLQRVGLAQQGPRLGQGSSPTRVHIRPFGDLTVPLRDGASLSQGLMPHSRGPA